MYEFTLEMIRQESQNRIRESMAFRDAWIQRYGVNPLDALSEQDVFLAAGREFVWHAVTMFTDKKDTLLVSQVIEWLWERTTAATVLLNEAATPATQSARAAEAIAWQEAHDWMRTKEETRLRPKPL